MSWLHWRCPTWLEGLRGRIAAALLFALAVQFIGSDILFERMEQAQMDRGRAQRLADWLSFADEFATTRPDAVQRMSALWEPDLIISRHAELPAVPRGQAGPDVAHVVQLVRAARPQMQRLDFQAVRENDDLVGVMRLSGGGWLLFRESDYFGEGRSQFTRYITLALLLLVCVALVALMIGRMIVRPLGHIADAAERVGRDEAVPIDVNGPREVRQVAAAFDRMQQRLRAQFSDRLHSMAAMSHDLRTPLARMRLNSSTVEDADTRAALQEDVEEMEAFVTSVLDYLRGEEPEDEEHVDIASIVMTVVDEAHDRQEAAEYVGPSRLEARSRPRKLKRLVRNIVQNATRHAGSAHVTLDRTDTAIRIVVTDEGPGIPEDQLDAVLEPFRRVEGSRSRRTGGSGLGLAIALRLVDRLGGSLSLANRAGRGLAVTILLPFDPVLPE